MREGLLLLRLWLYLEYWSGRFSYLVYRYLRWIQNLELIITIAINQSLYHPCVQLGLPFTLLVSFLWLLRHLRLKATLVIAEDWGLVKRTLALPLLAITSPIITDTFSVRGFSFVLNVYFLVELTLLSLSLLKVDGLKKVAFVLCA